MMATIRLCSHDGCDQTFWAKELCREHYAQQHYRLNKEKKAAQGRANYFANKERILARQLERAEENKVRVKAWRAKNKEVLREKSREHSKKTRAERAARDRLREIRKQKQAPTWINEAHKMLFAAIFKHAAQLSKELERPMHVDHIVPISGKHVSGLHVPWNLQVITAEENMRKHNCFNFEEYRQQWLR